MYGILISLKSNPVSLQKWNNELEKMAQEYAEKCKFGHNPNSVTESFNYVGENIYANSGIN